jgi:dipeptidyl aminopeptidase/acylaminoacyl peptidase
MTGARRALAVSGLLAALAALAWWPVPTPPAPSLEAVVARARPFATDPGLQLAPRFSRDGRQVAFAFAEGGDSRIVVQATDGSSRRFIGATSGVRTSPVFFPDGKRIAFWLAADDACGIVERNLESGAERTLVDCSLLPRVRFDLSPDGRTLVFTGSRTPEAPAGLWLVSVEGGLPRALTSAPQGAGDDLHPRFSPDGSAIAFFRGADGLRQPWIVPIADPSRARAVGRECGRCYGLAWLGAREALLVAAEWYGEPGLRAVALGDGHTVRAGARDARFPDVSVAGDVVYELPRADASPPRTHAAMEPAANVRTRPAREQIDLAIARR